MTSPHSRQRRSYKLLGVWLVSGRAHQTILVFKPEMISVPTRGDQSPPGRQPQGGAGAPSGRQRIRTSLSFILYQNTYRETYAASEARLQPHEN